MMQADTYEKTGFLLINLGTPDSTDVADVRRYLGEFLMDPFVLSAPTLIRALIVYGFILPFRPHKSAEAYASIWTEAGSPLLTGSQNLAREVAAELQAPVALSMRYGQPSIKSGIDELAAQGVAHVYPSRCDIPYSRPSTALPSTVKPGVNLSNEIYPIIGIIYC